MSSDMIFWVPSLRTIAIAFWIFFVLLLDWAIGLQNAYVDADFGDVLHFRHGSELMELLIVILLEDLSPIPRND